MAVSPSQRRAIAAVVVAGAALVGILSLSTQLTPDAVLPSTDCGRERIDFSTGDVGSPEVRSCILAAYEQHRRAHSEHVRPTIEGDPIAYVIRLSGGDDYELTIDASKDRYGSGQITHYRCSGMTVNASFRLRLFNCGPGIAAFDLP